MRIETLLATLSACALLLPTAWAEDAPPPNDAIARAIPILAIGEAHAGTLAGATLEPGEFRCYLTPSTVWYSYRATRSGPHLVSTAGSEADTTLAVLTQGPDGLRLLGCHGDVPGDDTGSARVGFLADAGRTYLIQVGKDEHYGSSAEVAFQVRVLHGAAVPYKWPVPFAGHVGTDGAGHHDASGTLYAMLVYDSVRATVDGDDLAGGSGGFAIVFGYFVNGAIAHDARVKHDEDGTDAVLLGAVASGVIWNVVGATVQHRDGEAHACAAAARTWLYDQVAVCAP